MDDFLLDGPMTFFVCVVMINAYRISFMFVKCEIFHWALATPTPNEIAIFTRSHIYTEFGELWGMFRSSNVSSKGRRIIIKSASSDDQVLTPCT